MAGSVASVSSIAVGTWSMPGEPDDEDAHESTGEDIRTPNALIEFLRIEGDSSES